jgi:hypothetical protein
MSQQLSASQAKKAAAAAKARQTAMRAELEAQLRRPQSAASGIEKYIYSQIPDNLQAIIGNNINSNKLHNFIAKQTNFKRGDVGSKSNYNIRNLTNIATDKVGKTLWSYHVFPSRTNTALVKAKLAGKQAAVLKAIKQFLTKNANEIRNSRRSVGILGAYGRRTTNPSHAALRTVAEIKNLSRTLVAARTGRTHSGNTAKLAKTNTRVQNINTLYKKYLKGLLSIEPMVAR